MDRIADYAPIVVFVYNRPDYTRKMLTSLNVLNEAGYSDIYIFADAPKSKENIELVAVVDNVIQEFIIESKFHKTYYIKRNTNYGLAKSIIEGVTEVIDKYGKAIVLEDDLIVSDDFLDYMNRGLEYYADNTEIWSISGYTMALKALSNYSYDVYLSGRGCSWGWATWKNRWDLVDWTFNDYSSFRFNIWKRKRFSAWGRDLPYLADAYHYGEIHSWAIRWCYCAFKNKMLTVYPKYSRVINTGTDGSGTNFKKYVSKYDTELYKVDAVCDFCMPPISNVIRKEFAHKYLTMFQLIKSEIRWSLIRWGLLKIK